MIRLPLQPSPDLTQYTEEVAQPVVNGNLLMNEESRLELEAGLQLAMQKKRDENA